MAQVTLILPSAAQFRKQLFSIMALSAILILT
jgi:hypothetical protein